MKFADLGLSEDILKAVADAGYDTPTPIQAQAIPSVLMARDILGCAQTGTGKTASFTLPMLDILHHGRARMRMPRSIILEPTRELATQVAANFDTYGKYMSLSKALIIGGESFVEQQKILEKGADVIIATPGRLIDTFERGKLLLSDCKLLVIDEADRMLDMGFIPDIEKIVNMLPKQRQTLFFSATMPAEIRRLADKFLSNPKEITVAPPSSMATTVEHQLLVMDDMDKREGLRRLIRQENVKNAFVFCNRKKDVDILFKSLTKHGFNAGRMHGDLMQSERTETLDKFKSGEITLLVCSDVAARGIDIADVSHVFNFDVPFSPEDYVHRTGRTGRAGRAGHAFTLATPEDGKLVAAIHKTIGLDIPLIGLDGIETLELDFSGKKRRHKKGGRSGRDDKPARNSGASANANANGNGNGNNAAANGGDGARPAPRDDRGERSERPDRHDRSERSDRNERPARAERNDRHERNDRNDRGERHERNDRNERADRSGDHRHSHGHGSNGGNVHGRPARNSRRDRDDHDDKPVIGFADHIPAFLLIPVPASSLGKSRPGEDDDAPVISHKPAAKAEPNRRDRQDNRKNDRNRSNDRRQSRPAPRNDAARKDDAAPVSASAPAAPAPVATAPVATAPVAAAPAVTAPSIAETAAPAAKPANDTTDQTAIATAPLENNSAEKPAAPATKAKAARKPATRSRAKAKTAATGDVAPVEDSAAQGDAAEAVKPAKAAAKPRAKKAATGTTAKTAKAKTTTAKATATKSAKAKAAAATEAAEGNAETDKPAKAAKAKAPARKTRAAAAKTATAPASDGASNATPAAEKKTPVRRTRKKAETTAGDSDA